MMTFISKLEARIHDIDSLLCIGLDPHPNDLQNKTGEAAKEFCVRIILETAELAAAYKPNAAFFEALGSKGFIALKEVINAIPDEIPVILDAKRGDISSTAKAYARAAFEILGADAVTVSPYLGRDSVEPFISNPEKGVFMLCKTSNPGAADFQDLAVRTGKLRQTDYDDLSMTTKLYEYVAKLAETWNINNNLGIVVGATHPGSLSRVREFAPDLWILAPGIGAQGGDLAEALQAGLRNDGTGMLIPVSRSISRSENPRDEAMGLRDAINRQRIKKSSLVIETTPNIIPNHLVLIADDLLDTGCIKFGSFTLKSGMVSPIYIDLRRLVGYPDLLSRIAAAYSVILSKLSFDHLAALPYAALPIASAISLQMGWPMVYPRKEIKTYGTKAQIEGVYEAGQKVAVIDDLISTGGSKFEGIRKLETAGLDVNDVVVLIDRSRDGGAELIESGYNLHAILTIKNLLSHYEQNNRVNASIISSVKEFLKL